MSDIRYIKIGMADLTKEKIHEFLQRAWSKGLYYLVVEDWFQKDAELYAADDISEGFLNKLNWIASAEYNDGTGILNRYTERYTDLDELENYIVEMSEEDYGWN